MPRRTYTTYYYTKNTTSPGPWMPNMVLWLKGDAGITLNGSTVSAWENKAAGYSYNLINTVAANQPTYQPNFLNGYPVLLFDGTDVLTASGYGFNASGLSGLSIYIVCYPTIQQGRYLLSTQGRIIECYTSATSELFSVGAGGFPRSGYPVTYRWKTRSMIYDGTALPNTNRLFQYENGIFMTSGPSGPVADTVPIGADGIRLCGIYGSGSAYIGYVAEVLIYRIAHNTSQRQQTENYLKIKYGHY